MFVVGSEAEVGSETQAPVDPADPLALGNLRDQSLFVAPLLQVLTRSDLPESRS
jgi:hypothetical protein